MPERTRIVLETNAVVSRLLLPASVPGRAVRKAVDRGTLLFSEATFAELAEVLARRKFDRYVSIEERQVFLRLLGRIAEMASVIKRIRACRDPRDDALLEVAINGRADLIVTGDADLLALNPFHDIPIITPAAYVAGEEVGG